MKREIKILIDTEPLGVQGLARVAVVELDDTYRLRSSSATTGWLTNPEMARFVGALVEDFFSEEGQEIKP